MFSLFFVTLLPFVIEFSRFLSLKSRDGDIHLSVIRTFFFSFFLTYQRDFIATNFYSLPRVEHGPCFANSINRFAQGCPCICKIQKRNILVSPWRESIIFFKGHETGIWYRTKNKNYHMKNNNYNNNNTKLMKLSKFQYPT